MRRTRGSIVSFLCAVLLLILAGCGGGGGASSTTAAGSTVTPGTISGTVTLDDGTKLGQVTLTITGASAESTDPNGYYEAIHLPDGDYTVTPSRPGYAFAPASRTVHIANNGVSASFTATVINISGKVTSSNGKGIAGAIVSVAPAAGGASLDIQTTDGGGNYTIGALNPGSYTVSVSHPDGYVFTPASQPVTLGATPASANFSAPAVATFTVSGKVTTAGGAGLAGVTVTITDLTASYSAVTDANGAYTIAGVGSGAYQMSATLLHYSFITPNLGVPVNNADATVNIDALPEGTSSVTFG